MTKGGYLVFSFFFKSKQCNSQTVYIYILTNETGSCVIYKKNAFSRKNTEFFSLIYISSKGVSNQKKKKSKKKKKIKTKTHTHKKTNITTNIK